MEGRVEYKGKVSNIIYQLQGLLRSSIVYIGAKNLKRFIIELNLLKLPKQVSTKVWYIVLITQKQ